MVALGHRVTGPGRIFLTGGATALLYGWRPMTYDSLPIIDRSPAMENVFIAAGHNMLGLTLCTATGKLITVPDMREPTLTSAPTTGRITPVATTVSSRLV